MTDGVIKGTGNSRYLKAPANVRTLYPTWDAALDALAAGTFPIDLNGINPSGWETVGMKLDKANLLTDALCTALGLDTTATPTQAMEKLRQLAAPVETKASLTTGMYTGTGATEDGSDYKALVFPFQPRLVFVARVMMGINSQLAIFTRDSGIGYMVYGATSSQSSAFGFTVVVGGNMMRWVVGTKYNQSTNFDVQGVDYDYIAIG